MLKKRHNEAAEFHEVVAGVPLPLGSSSSLLASADEARSQNVALEPLPMPHQSLGLGHANSTESRAGLSLSFDAASGDLPHADSLQQMVDRLALPEVLTRYLFQIKQIFIGIISSCGCEGCPRWISLNAFRLAWYRTLGISTWVYAYR